MHRLVSGVRVRADGRPQAGAAAVRIGRHAARIGRQGAETWQETGRSGAGPSLTPWHAIRGLPREQSEQLSTAGTGTD